MAAIGGHGAVPQNVGGLGRRILALALLLFALGAGPFLALADRALFGCAQLGR